MAITIKDVAKLAGVSISTVSRVINDSKPVSSEAKKKVLKAIDSLGYQPNEVARSLVTKKSNLIGVIVDDIASYYVSQMVRGIEEIGRMYNYDIVLCSSYGNSENEIKFLQLLRTKQVEGIILISEIMNDMLVDYIENNKFNFIYLNRYYNSSHLSASFIDNKKASTVMMDYLIELGHRKICYLSTDENSEITIERDKIAAYEEAMTKIGEKFYIHKIDSHRIYGGYLAGPDIKKLIEDEGITAIFASQDELALGLMNYFYDQGINVPEDISIVGYGDISVAALYRPSLTTIREPYYDIGAISVRKILKMINNEFGDTDIELPIRLIKRDSCKEIL